MGRTSKRNGRRDTPPEEAEVPAPAETSRRRTPVVLDPPRKRWPVLLWCSLTAVWLGGSAIFLALVLAEALFLFQSEEPDPAALRNMGAYLALLLFCGIAVPLGGAITAAVLRRRIAAIGFTVACIASIGVAVAVASPADYARALFGGLG
ncbi:hypothetical protein [Nocardiopsis coralliicola]